MFYVPYIYSNELVSFHCNDNVECSYNDNVECCLVIIGVYSSLIIQGLISIENDSTLSMYKN